MVPLRRRPFTKNVGAALTPSAAASAASALPASSGCFPLQRAGQLDAVAHLIQRIDGVIDRVAPEEVVPVAAHVEGDVLRLLAEGHLEVTLPPAGDLRVLELRHLEGESGRRDGLLEIID